MSETVHYLSTQFTRATSSQKVQLLSQHISNKLLLIIDFDISAEERHGVTHTAATLTHHEQQCKRERETYKRLKWQHRERKGEKVSQDRRGVCTCVCVCVWRGESGCHWQCDICWESATLLLPPSRPPSRLYPLFRSLPSPPPSPCALE